MITVFTGGRPPEKEAPGTVGTNAGALKQSAFIDYHEGLNAQPIPQRVLEVLASMPAVLDSMDALRWLLRAFCVLARYYPPGEAVDILEEAVVRRRDMEMDRLFHFR